MWWPTPVVPALGDGGRRSSQSQAKGADEDDGVTSAHCPLHRDTLTFQPSTAHPVFTPEELLLTRWPAEKRGR